MTLAAALDRTLLLCRDAELLGRNRPSDEQILAAFRQTSVLLVADEANLGSAAGQHLLVALVDLVARLGVTLRLALPEVPVLGHQPPLRGGAFRAALLDFSRDVLPECAGSLAAPDEPADLAFVLGDTHWSGTAGLALRLAGDAWSAASYPPGHAAARWRGDFPIGALAAAGIAAPEVFKSALRRLSAALPHPTPPDFLAPVEHAAVRLAPERTGQGPFALGPVDAVSGGAVVNAALFALLHLPRVTAAARVIEPERVELSNTNRYALVRLSDCGRAKVAALRAWRRTGFAIEGLPMAFTAATDARILPFAPSVLVGVDDVPARWAVQREWPRWLGVGATSHFLTVTSSHRIGQPCAGCLHPYDDPGPARIPTVSFVSYWAGLLLAVRLLRDIAGHPLDGVEQAIDCSPLRLDQPWAYWPRPVARRPQCPVGCLSATRGRE